MKHKLLEKFYIDKETNLPDLENYGVYRLGLTRQEVKDYLLARAMVTNYPTRNIEAKFYRIFGINTCASINGVTLLYRHDIQRFADVMFQNKPTFFD